MSIEIILIPLAVAAYGSWKARSMEKGLWDLGAMYADDMLKSGVRVIESEIRRYIRSVLDDLNMRFI